mmetsp:Transcript_13242/g.24814  ORF Transcript_13242/g.24814 Transcript_13242/m.24814 type:complete len:305 (-) Transcript_13242:23-937(-)
MVSFHSNVRLSRDVFVHHLEFDFYGKLLACACSNQNIDIYELSDNSWVKSGTCQGHSGIVCKVRWAHPEFGRLLASCSHDKSVKIWEGRADDSNWNFVASLSESKEAVVDIRFAPKHQGLQLASCSAHGEVRIYEASDLINLTVWNTLYIFQTSPYGTNCCAWNPSEPAMLIVGNNCDGSVQTVAPEPLQVWTLNRATKRWEKTLVVEDIEASVLDVDWAPLVCRRSHLIATSSKDGSVIVWRFESNIMKVESPLEAGGVAVRVTWNILGTCLAIANDRGEVSLWKRNLYKRWEKLRDFAPSSI